MGNYLWGSAEKESDDTAKAGHTESVLNGNEDAHEIQDGLFLGNLGAAESSAWRTANGISHILSVLPHQLSPVPSNIKRLQLRVRDSHASLIAGLFGESIQFIDEALKSGGRVLVHCWKGVSRSATIVIAYVMRSQRLQYEAALALVQARRACVEPNPGFQTQLVCITFFLCPLALARLFLEGSCNS